MKRILLLSLLCSILSLGSMAQKDGNAKQILDRAAAAIRNSKGITASFSSLTKNRSNRTSGSTRGQITLKGNKYFIQEGNNQIISNGAKVWNYNGENEVVVSNANESSSFSPETLLAGKINTADFNYKLVSAAGSQYVVSLTPIDRRKSFTSVQLYIGKSNSLINKALVKDKSGNTIIFSLSNVKNNVSISDSHFAFDTRKHPHVEVVNN